MKQMIHGYLKVRYLVPDVKKEIELMLKPYLQIKPIYDKEQSVIYELICSIAEWQKLTLELAPDATDMRNTDQKYSYNQIHIAIDAYQIE